MMLKTNNKFIPLYLSIPILFSTLLFGLQLSVNAQNIKRVEDLVKSLSNEKLKVETRATPYQLVGDFNGDKVNDVAVIVSLSDTVEKTAKTVKVAYPYYFGKEVDAEDLALFIIHGKGKGWQFAQKSSVLFLGRNSALIFQKARLGEKGDGMELDKDKRGKVSIYFVTEGSSGTLKWNGKKYIWTESEP
jgi:hypothetical protein